MISQHPSANTNDPYFKAVNLILSDFPSLHSLIIDQSKQRLKLTREAAVTLSSGLSPGEKLLINMAFDLWEGVGSTSALDVYQLLGKRYLSLFCKAIELIYDT